jgi:adenylate cyclase
LETANKIYGCAILASESTVAACGDSFAFREVDRARLPGRHGVERIFEPMGASSALTERDADLIRRFGAALADYRERRFAEAAVGFGTLADGDPTAGYFARICADFAQHPPPDDWNAVTRIKHK